MSKNCSYCHKDLNHGGLIIHQECLALLEEALDRNMWLMEENSRFRQLVAVQGRELKRLMALLNMELPLAS